MPNNTKEAKFLACFFVPPCRHWVDLEYGLGLAVQTDTRSGEENRKQYGVPDVNMLEKKKRWKDLNSF